MAKIMLVDDAAFMRMMLKNLVDWEKFASLKLCGDYYLWLCFSKKVRLHILNTYLGGFRVRAGQLSSNVEDYNSEVKSITEQPNIRDIILSYISKGYYKIFRGGILYHMVGKNVVHNWNSERQRFI